MHRIATTCAALLASLLAASPAGADRKNPLEGQPAVRHRLLLVKQRFEFAPAFESSVNADFQHTFSGGLKLEYHLTDMFSIGAVGFYGKGFNTKLNSRIVDDLPETTDEGDPTPTHDEWVEHLNEIQAHGAAYVTVTPWYGKLAAFSKFFVNFDFYFSGGVALASLKNDCSPCSFETDPAPGGDLEADPPILADNDPNDDQAINDGTRVGAYLGGGIHLFLSNWMALDLTVRSYLFSDNPSGLDFNADLAVTEDDNRFLNHLFMGVGLSFFLPASVERTP